MKCKIWYFMFPTNCSNHKHFPFQSSLWSKNISFAVVDIPDWKKRHLLYILPIRNTLKRPDGQRKLSGKLANFIFWLIPTIEPFHSQTAELHGFWLFAIINNWFIPGTVCKMFVKYRTNRDVRRNQFSALLGGHRAINSFIDNCSF